MGSVTPSVSTNNQFIKWEKTGGTPLIRSATMHLSQNKTIGTLSTDDLQMYKTYSSSQ